MLTRLALLIALLTLAAPAAAQPIVAGPPLAPPEAAPLQPQPVETPAEALEADAAEYGRTSGLPEDEALRQLEAQEASVPLVDRLAASYRDRLAGVVVEHWPVFRVVIVVTGTPAAETQIGTAPFGAPIVLRTGAIATRDAVLAAIAAHQADLRAALPAPPALTVDPRTGALLILVRRGALDGGDDAPATAARLQLIAGVPVEIRTWDEIDTNLSVEGGGRVFGSPADSPRRYLCTSGFVVTNGQQTAVATAAHCPDSLTFVDGATRTPLAMIGAWGAGTQDVQIHSADEVLPPLFHADDPARARVVASWRNRTSTRAGDVVCHRGERSGYSCATVQFVDFAPAGDLCAGPCPPTWVAVSGPSCKGGDSGGPVFVGSVAFGLVKGESSDDGLCRLYYYMSTDYLPPGWTLLHGGAPAGPPDAVTGTAVAGSQPAAPPLPASPGR